jgi:hypothetical protein
MIKNTGLLGVYGCETSVHVLEIVRLYSGDLAIGSGTSSQEKNEKQESQGINSVSN